MRRTAAGRGRSATMSPGAVRARWPRLCCGFSELWRRWSSPGRTAGRGRIARMGRRRRGRGAGRGRGGVSVDGAVPAGSAGGGAVGGSLSEGWRSSGIAARADRMAAVVRERADRGSLRGYRSGLRDAGLRVRPADAGLVLEGPVVVGVPVTTGSVVEEVPVMPSRGREASPPRSRRCKPRGERASTWYRTARQPDPGSGPTDREVRP